jgi:hypothetical protein
VFDSPVFTTQTDAQHDGGMIATDGWGAFAICVAGMTRTRRASSPSHQEASDLVVETSRARRIGLLGGWRQQLGTYFIAVGEWLTIGSAAATSRGGGESAIPG